jgi:hypothetical protein
MAVIIHGFDKRLAEKHGDEKNIEVVYSRSKIMPCDETLASLPHHIAAVVTELDAACLRARRACWHIAGCHPAGDCRPSY